MDEWNLMVQTRQREGFLVFCRKQGDHCAVRPCAWGVPVLIGSCYGESTIRELSKIRYCSVEFPGTAAL